MINTIIIDCDGCLTDGKKYIDPQGVQRAMVAFHSRDNTAVERLIAAGFRVIIVTASRCPIIRRYWGKYNVEVYATRDKDAIEGVEWERTLGVGDDLLDAPFLRRCAVAYVPADAHPDLRDEFNILRTRGGAGIMAEVEAKAHILAQSENGIKYLYNGTTY